MIKRNWSDISTDSISEEAIRALHQPQESFKMYVNTYEPGKSIPAKAGHPFVLYVLAGSCKISLDGTEVMLSASDVIALEQGAYTIDVTGNAELKLVKIFGLS